MGDKSSFFKRTQLDSLEVGTVKSESSKSQNRFSFDAFSASSNTHKFKFSKKTASESTEKREEEADLALENLISLQPKTEDVEFVKIVANEETRSSLRTLHDETNTFSSSSIGKLKKTPSLPAKMGKTSSQKPPPSAQTEMFASYFTKFERPQSVNKFTK